MRYNWVQKNASGNYDLSYGIASAAGKIFRCVHRYEILQPVINSLSEKTGLSSKISLRSGLHEFKTVVKAEPDSPIALFSKIGSRFPVVEGSVGGVSLCESDDLEIARLLKAAPEGTAEKLNRIFYMAGLMNAGRKGAVFAARKTIGIQRLFLPLLKVGSGQQRFFCWGLPKILKERKGRLPESSITGTDSDKQKFMAWARTCPATIGGSLFDWSRLELNNFFGVREPLSEKNAEEIWDRCN